VSDTPFEQMARNAQIAQNNREIREVQRARHAEGRPVSRRDAAALIAKSQSDTAKAEAARIGELVAKSRPQAEQTPPTAGQRLDVTIPKAAPVADLTDPHVIPRRERGDSEGERATVLLVVIGTGPTFTVCSGDVRVRDLAPYP